MADIVGEQERERERLAENEQTSVSVLEAPPCLIRHFLRLQTIVSRQPIVPDPNRYDLHARSRRTILRYMLYGIPIRIACHPILCLSLVRLMFSKEPPMLKDLFLGGSAGGQHYRIHEHISSLCIFVWVFLLPLVWGRGGGGGGGGHGDGASWTRWHFGGGIKSEYQRGDTLVSQLCSKPYTP